MLRSRRLCGFRVDRAVDNSVARVIPVSVLMCVYHSLHPYPQGGYGFGYPDNIGHQALKDPHVLYLRIQLVECGFPVRMR